MENIKTCGILDKKCPFARQHDDTCKGCNVMYAYHKGYQEGLDFTEMESEDD